MERLLYCSVHRTRPVEYVCLACDNLRMCEECKRGHVDEEGHALENCKEVGLTLMHQHLEDAGGRQAKELTKGLREALKELETGLLGEVDRFWLNLVQTEEQRKMQELVNEGRYAELYLYTKRLSMGGANTGDVMRRLNKRLLKILDTTYEGLEKVRNKIAADAGETLAERIARMEEDIKNLTDILAGKEESLRNCLAACDARGLKEMFKESTAAINKEQESQKKKDLIQKLGDYLNTVENGLDSALGKLNAQLGTKAAEVREFKRVLDAKADEVNKRIAEEEEKKKPLSAEKGEFTLVQGVAERLLAEYTGHKVYVKVKKAYEDLVSNSSGDPVPRTVMLIYYYRSFAHPCGLGDTNLSDCSVGDKGATIIACGLKLSTNIVALDLRKQTPTRL